MPRGDRPVLVSLVAAALRVDGLLSVKLSVLAFPSAALGEGPAEPSFFGLPLPLFSPEAGVFSSVFPSSAFLGEGFFGVAGSRSGGVSVCAPQTTSCF